MTKRKRQISFRCGHAEKNGFMIEIYSPKDKRIDKHFFKTPEYAIKHDEKPYMIDWLFAGIILIIYLCILNLVVRPPNIFVGMFSYILISISFYMYLFFHMDSEIDVQENGMPANNKPLIF